MTALDLELRRCLEGNPVVGALDQAFLFLTVSPSGAVDVCVLSRAEMRPTDDGIAAVVASRRARANLGERPVATLVAVAGDAVHSLTCEVAGMLDGDDATALSMTVVAHRRDGLGIELRPILFRVEERLQVEERWDRTALLLGLLGSAAH
ncbi:MAG: hypothetical protein ACRDWW_03915, partial [Acidimicrobiales bacterium]